MCNFDEILKLFGQKKMADSFPVVIASDQSAIRVTIQGTTPIVIPGIVTVNQGTSPWVVSGTVAVSGPITISGTVAVTQTGTWDITNITGTISLPTGASTSANQVAANASLVSIDGKITLDYGVSTAAIRTASQIGNTIGAANFGAGITTGQTLRVVLPTDQSAIPVSQSGTWNINNITGTISLPTGASTSALQTAGNASLASIDSKLTNPLPISGTVTANQGGSWTVTANAGTNLNTSALALAITQTDRTQKTQLTDGTRDGTIKAASTAAIAADTSLVVALSPNSPLPTGSNIIGALTANQSVNLNQYGGVATTLGQKLMAASMPVTIASDQSPLAVTGPLTDTQLRATPVPISGTISISGTVPVSGTVTVNQGTSPWVTSVSGTVAVTQSGAWSTGRTWTLSSGTDSVTVTGTVAATQSGTWDINNITGTISLPTGASTSVLQTAGNVSLASIDSKLTNPLPISGTVTANQGTSPWVVSGTVAVTGPITISGTVAVTQSGTWAVGTTLDTNYGTVGANTLRTAAQIGNATGAADFAAGNSGSQTLRVVVATDQLPIPVTQSGTWDINNITGTISLPTGAATAGLQTAGNASLVSIDAGIPTGLGQTTMANSMPVVIASDQSAITVTAVNLDIRDLVFATDKVDVSGSSVSISNFPATVSVTQGTSPWVVSGTVAATQSGAWTTGRTWALASGTDSVDAVQSGTWILGANSGVDIGDVTVNNGAGAAAVNIQDGGNSITVDGTVTVTQGTSPWVVSGAVTLPYDTNYGVVGATTLRTASQIGNATGAANFGAGATTAQTLRVVLPTDQTAIPVTQSGAWTTGRTWTLASGTDSISAVQSGTWNITNITGTISLPTGASTSALQTTGNASLASIDSKLTLNYGASPAAIRTASQIGNTTGPADFNSGVTGAQTLRTAANLYDGSGVAITSTLLGGKQRLDVNLAAGGSVGPGVAGIQSVLAGGVFNSTLPTLTNTQQAAVQLDSNGRLIVNATPVDGTKPTYRAATISVALAALTTDFFTLTGSASKTIRVLYTSCVVAGGGLIYNLQLVKRSTANTGGTSTNLTEVPLDSNEAAATATALSYTANPTLGTLVGAVATTKVNSPLTSSTTAPQIAEFSFGNRPGQAIVLRGTSQVLAWNGNATTGATNASCYIEWTEE